MTHTACVSFPHVEKQTPRLMPLTGSLLPGTYDSPVH